MHINRIDVVAFIIRRPSADKDKSGLDGLRDEAMLDSALSVAFQTFDGVELYQSTAAKIARIAYGLVCNHPYIDGNKKQDTF